MVLFEGVRGCCRLTYYYCKVSRLGPSRTPNKEEQNNNIDDVFIFGRIFRSLTFRTLSR